MLELGGQPIFNDGTGGAEGEGAEQAAPAAAALWSGRVVSQQEGGAERRGQPPAEPSERVAAQGLEHASGHVEALPESDGLLAQVAAGGRAETNQLFDLRGDVRVASHSRSLMNSARVTGKAGL